MVRRSFTSTLSFSAPINVTSVRPVRSGGTMLSATSRLRKSSVPESLALPPRCHIALSCFSKACSRTAYAFEPEEKLTRQPKLIARAPWGPLGMSVDPTWVVYDTVSRFYGYVTAQSRHADFREKCMSRLPHVRARRWCRCRRVCLASVPRKPRSLRRSAIGKSRRAIGLPASGATIASAQTQTVLPIHGPGGTSEFCKVLGAIQPVDPNAPPVNLK